MSSKVNKNDNKQIIIIAILCAALLGISIAYAVLSSTFNLTFGRIVTNELTWNVGLESGTVKVKNTGGVPAELSAIVPKTPSGTACDTSKTGEMTCGNVTYKLTSDEDGLAVLGLGNVIAQTTGTMDLYLVAEYTGTEVGVAEDQSAGGFALTFSQK